MAKRIVSLADVVVAATELRNDMYHWAGYVEHVNSGRLIKLYGVPRGGIPAALAVLAVPPNGHRLALTDNPENADFIIDDIWDSGATAQRYQLRFPSKPFRVLFDKSRAPWKGQWLVMPWEVTEAGNDKSAEDIATRLLEYIGEDPSREGLVETPGRWMKAWREWATGYGQKPEDVLKVFTDGAEGVNEMVVVHNIPVVSKCEHHLADITGIAHVGYIPGGKIVGLSKLARLVDVFGRRLQVQERLTNEIANALDTHLKPVGVGVIVRAAHACMSTRGVKIHGSTTTTSAFRGALLEPNNMARLEFMQHCDAAERNNR